MLYDSPAILHENESPQVTGERDTKRNTDMMHGYNIPDVWLIPVYPTGLRGSAIPLTSLTSLTSLSSPGTRTPRQVRANFIRVFEVELPSANSLSLFLSPHLFLSLSHSVNNDFGRQQRATRGFNFGRSDRLDDDE